MTVLEHLGAGVLVSVDAGGERIQVVVDDESEPEVGTEGWVVASPSRSLVFDDAGELVDAQAVGGKPEPAAVLDK